MQTVIVRNTTTSNNEENDQLSRRKLWNRDCVWWLVPITTMIQFRKNQGYIGIYVYERKQRQYLFRKNNNHFEANVSKIKETININFSFKKTYILH